MTITTKQYVELSDLLTFRFECKHKECGGVLEIPFSRFDKGMLAKCPKCGHEWTALSRVGAMAEIRLHEPRVEDFIEAYNKLRQDAELFGCSLAIQVKASE